MSRDEGRPGPGANGRHFSPSRPQGGAWLLILVAMLYALFLLGSPLAAIVNGAISSGIGVLLRQMVSAESLHALRLTILLGIAATILNTIFGLALALVLARDPFRGRRLIDGLIDLPFAVSPVIAGLMLLLLFGRGGWFTGIVDAFDLRIVFALPGMLLATVFITFPLVARELLPVLRHHGTDQEMVARTLGAGSWRTFREITLPNIRAGLLYGMLLTFARSVGEFGAVLVIGGGVMRLTETSTLFIYRALDDRNEAGAYGMALTLAGLSLGMILVMGLIRRPFRGEETTRKGG